MLRLDLLFGGASPHFVELVDQGGIVHAAKPLQEVIGDVEVEFARQPLFFQPDVVPEKPE